MNIRETDIYEEGKNDGIAQGISQGAEQKAIETAKNFIKMGFSLEQVAQGTGLSLETIQNLAKEQNAEIFQR